MAHNRFFEVLIGSPVLSQFHGFYNANTQELNFKRIKNVDVYDSDVRAVLALYYRYHFDLPTVSILNVDRIWLAREGLTILEWIIELNLPELTSLSLRDCELDNAAIKSLQLALLRNDFIKSIDISDNNCADDTVRDFSFAMSKKSGSNCVVKAEKGNVIDRFFSKGYTKIKAPNEETKKLRFSFSD